MLLLKMIGSKKIEWMDNRFEETIKDQFVILKKVTCLMSAMGCRS